jgi:hypothetical protein
VPQLIAILSAALLALPATLRAADTRVALPIAITADRFDACILIHFLRDFSEFGSHPHEIARR